MTVLFVAAFIFPVYVSAKDDAGSAKPAREGIVKEPEQLYNEGVVLYKERQYPKAADSFSSALVTKEPDLEAKANYNIANSKYKEGKALGPGKEGTIIRLNKEALDYYKRSMELDQADEDAKFNYEFVQKELKALEAKQQQQKKEQQQQRQKQEQKQDKQQGGQENQQQQQQQQGQQQQEQESRQAQEEKQKQDQKAQEEKTRQAEEQKAKEEEQKAQEEEKQGQAQEPQEEEKGGMSRQEAQILLDAYGQQEEGTLKLQKRHTERDVEKDW